MESRNEPVESPRPKSWRMTQPLLVPNKMTSLPAAMQVITPRPFAAYLSRRSTVNTCLPAWSIFQFNSHPCCLSLSVLQLIIQKKSVHQFWFTGDQLSINYQRKEVPTANGRKPKRKKIKKRRRFVLWNYSIVLTWHC